MAIVIAVIVLALHDTFVFPTAVAAITALAVWELIRAANCKRLVAPAVITVGYSFLYLFCDFFDDPGRIHFALKGVFAFGLVCCFLKMHESMSFWQAAFMGLCGLIVPPALGKVVAIADMKYGMFLVVLTLACAWLADSGAYFAGTFFGHTKLCPSISPKKTVEGVIGGCVSNALIALIMCLVYDKAVKGGDVGFNYLVVILAAAACAVIGLLGDLTASLIKRQCGIKDYGNLMPGHGGAMDRFDSVLFVAPFMYLMISSGLLF